MAGCYNPLWRRTLEKVLPFLFKQCPDGNSHWRWDRMCYCMTHERRGNDGGVWDFKHKWWIRGEIVRRP